MHLISIKQSTSINRDVKTLNSYNEVAFEHERGTLVNNIIIRILIKKITLNEQARIIQNTFLKDGVRKNKIIF